MQSNDIIIREFNGSYFCFVYVSEAHAPCHAAVGITGSGSTPIKALRSFASKCDDQGIAFTFAIQAKRDQSENQIPSKKASWSWPWFSKRY